MADPDNGWRFAQCFGDKGDVEDVTEADIISAVEFDHTGDYLATGDRGGRVVLFERNEGKKSCEYKFFTEFQSHEPEFDYLKSLEIEEKINKIRWCKRKNAAHFLLSTNVFKSMSEWPYFKHFDCVNEPGFASPMYSIITQSKYPPFIPVFDKQIKVVNETLLGDKAAVPHPFPKSALKLPKMIHHDSITAAIPRKIYQNAHGYHINSISVNSDQETYLSADDLRINLWNLDISDQSFSNV